MKRVTIRLICLVFCVSALFFQAKAQNDESMRQNVVIDYFSCTRYVPIPFMDAVRNGVIINFIDRGRHNVIDAQRSVPPPGSSISIRTWNPQMLSEMRRSADMAYYDAIQALDARYIISGDVIQYTQTRSGQPNSMSYTTLYTFNLHGYDTQTNAEIRPREFRFTGTGNSAQIADTRAIESMNFSLQLYINDNFKFETRILELGSKDKKGKIKELFIKCGSSIGVHNGDLFIVYAIDKIGDTDATRQIGRLRVRETLGPNVSRCTISKGADDIIKAINDNKSIIVVSDNEALF